MGDPSSSSQNAGSTGDGSIVDDVQEVKGLTFVTMRAHLIETLGQARWDELMAIVPRRTRTLFDTAEITGWYPETELRRFIHVIYERLADSDDERFLELARGIALAGINRFFRMVLSLASGRFVLRHIPTLWNRLRRGPAVLRTEVAADGRVLIHYENFRYCRDPVYRLLSIANCQAAVFAATKSLPKASVQEWDRYTMTLAFELVDPSGS